MRIATWNINSLRVRLPHVIEWLRQNPVDALGLQELKMQNSEFPHEAFADIGYRAVWNGQKTYNGVAIVSPHEIEDLRLDLDDFADEQKRVIAATVRGVRIVNVYVPNGQSVGSEKYDYKLAWLEALRGQLEAEISQYPKLAVTGDYNIAPAAEDTHDPATWEGNILCSDAERERFRALLALGLSDSFRLFEQPEKSFTWWDYRAAGFRRNHGLRIDHVLATPALAERCRACVVDLAPRRLERPSDHAPVIADYDVAIDAG